MSGGSKRGVAKEPVRSGKREMVKGSLRPGVRDRKGAFQVERAKRAERSLDQGLRRSWAIVGPRRAGKQWGARRWSQPLFCYKEKSAAALPLAARALYSLTMASRLTVEVARGWGSSSGGNQPTSVLSSSPTKGAASSSVGEQMKRMSMYRHWSPFAYFTR